MFEVICSCVRALQRFTQSLTFFFYDHGHLISCQIDPMNIGVSAAAGGKARTIINHRPSTSGSFSSTHPKTRKGAKST